MSFRVFQNEERARPEYNDIRGDESIGGGGPGVTEVSPAPAKTVAQGIMRPMTRLVSIRERRRPRSDRRKCEGHSPRELITCRIGAEIARDLLRLLSHTTRVPTEQYHRRTLLIVACTTRSFVSSAGPMLRILIRSSGQT